MGGTSKTTQTQNSTTEPWAPAQDTLKGILGQLQGNLGNTGVTGAESGALNTLVQNGNNATSQYAQPIANYAQTLLGGGGALLVFLGVASLSATVAHPVSKAIGAPIQRLFPVAGRIARDNASRAPRRAPTPVIRCRATSSTRPTSSPPGPTRAATSCSARC